MLKKLVLGLGAAAASLGIAGVALADYPLPDASSTSDVVTTGIGYIWAIVQNFLTANWLAIISLIFVFIAIGFVTGFIHLPGGRR